MSAVAGAVGGSVLTAGAGYSAYLWSESKRRAEEQSRAEAESKKSQKDGPGAGGRRGMGAAAAGAPVGFGAPPFDEGPPGGDPLADEPEPQGSLLETRAMKFEDIAQEARELVLDNSMEFQEGVVVNLQKPIVAPPGTPGPPIGPGPHKNFQAQMAEKFVLGNAQTSHATFSVQSTFRPDQRDALSCTYSTQGLHSGLLVRSWGPCDFVAQWMQQPHGMPLGLYANADVKHGTGVTSFTSIRHQMLQAQHLQGIFRNFYLGTKVRYDLGQRTTHFGAGFRWAAPEKKAVWSAEVEDTGHFKVSLVKQAAGMADTTFCGQVEFGSAHKPDHSMCTLGFKREYLNNTRVRLAVNTDFQVKGVVEMPVGRVCNVAYNVQYDPGKRNLKHGFTFQM
eukprot:TRINITY_DN70390_c0_g1_i1.p1 TRINITY_DN70390_c0_g1~~TRINITY_DN70390_c0_g1_i1.p1  ORF type:complete len:392 (+),score=125.35 TRINITY_DN70390_c0_g1_i1:89-1264(+)